MVCISVIISLTDAVDWTGPLASKSAYQLGREVPGSNPGKGKNFKMKIKRFKDHMTRAKVCEEYRNIITQICLLIQHVLLSYSSSIQSGLTTQIRTYPRATQQGCIKRRHHITVPAVPTQEAIWEESG